MLHITMIRAVVSIARIRTGPPPCTPTGRVTQGHLPNSDHLPRRRAVSTMSSHSERIHTAVRMGVHRHCRQSPSGDDPHGGISASSPADDLPTSIEQPAEWGTSSSAYHGTFLIFRDTVVDRWKGDMTRSAGYPNWSVRLLYCYGIDTTGEWDTWSKGLSGRCRHLAFVNAYCASRSRSNGSTGVEILRRRVPRAAPSARPPVGGGARCLSRNSSAASHDDQHGQKVPSSRGRPTFLGKRLPKKQSADG